MDQPQNQMYPTSPDGRRLKKVKRPVKRIVPQQPNIPPVSPASDDDFFNIDNILDNSNLPALQNRENDTYVQNQYQESTSAPRFISEEDVLREQAALKGKGFLTQMTTNKNALIIAGIAFVVGILFAKIFLSSAKVVRDGLQGVVVNTEVPRGRARCGVAERTQGCVLYIMNPQRQELNASDFYDLAAQLTGRQRFIIETGNMRYSNRKIKPGEIAQFNIPPLQ